MIDSGDRQEPESDASRDAWSVGKPGVFNSKWGLIFLFFGAFGELSLGARMGLLVLIWWGFLFVFWTFTAFSLFDSEKKWIANRRTAMGATTKGRLLAIPFYLLYWPIYLPKMICLWFMCVLVVIYYLGKLLN